MRKSKKIFVGSMTDIFGEWVPDWMLFSLLDAMSQAALQTFQLLTKRPERAYNVVEDWLYNVGLDQLPPNIWLGISAEDQRCLDERLIWLIRTPARVRFLSLEPLLGPITLFDADGQAAQDLAETPPYGVHRFPVDYIDWVIVGGESGPNARALELEWIEDILMQCKAASIPAYPKQLGSHWAKATGASHSKGGDPDEWPAALRVRMFPGEAW